MGASATAELDAAIAAVERDGALDDEPNFAGRAAAADALELHVLDRIDGLLASGAERAALVALRERAEAALRRLAAADAALFGRLRGDIRTGACRGAALRAVIDASVGPAESLARPLGAAGYDALDVFVNGLLGVAAVPDETAALEAEMVRYQQTPARVILALVDMARLGPDDVFFDIGSGLGHVPILAHLLSGAEARGVEVEPAFCADAAARAEGLGLGRVTFVQADARAADYAAGTVFFLYTPFTGAMLRQVLARLHAEARGRPIRVVAYGPCAAVVGRRRWLRRTASSGRGQSALVCFASRAEQDGDR